MEYQLTQTGEQVQNILDQAPTTEQNLQSEITRSTEKDQELESAIATEKQRAEGVESELQTAIGNEQSRAEGVEANLQDAIGAEKTRAEGIEGGLRTDVDGIESKIPTGASSENKLATEGFVNSSIATNTAEFKGTFPSLEALQTEVQDANQNDYAFVISTDASGNTVYNRYKYVTGTGWVFEYALNNSSFTSAQWAAINSAITAALVAKLNGLPNAAELTQQLNAIIDSVATEKTRAEGAEAVLRQSISTNAAAIVTEKNRAEGVEGTLTTGLNGEILARQNADTALQQNINAEATLRDNADDALQAEIDGINAKIPTQASASNQLADKAFVNSSIATNTGEFKGTYNSLAELQAVTNVNANDYGFVIATDGTGNTVYNRYKYVTGQGWVFEYALNNSSFTAAQWGAINSGITAALAAKINGLPDIDALNAMFAAITSKIPADASSSNKLVDYAQLVYALSSKQDTLIFDNVPTEGSNNPVKSGGIYQSIATVTAAIVGLQSSKQDVLTFDQYPTAGSNNPVRSTGIYSAIENAVAPKANQTDLDNAVIRISTNEVDIAQLQAAYRGLTQNDVVPVAPTDTWPVANPQENVIYRVVDRTNTPPQYYTDYMWNGTVMVEMAQYDNAIDDIPTPGSNNLVKSGGVASHIVYDISEANAVGSTLATYADLAAALGASGANVPESVRRGGMSIKFVQSSDDNYVQYRLTSTSFSINENDWTEIGGGDGIYDISAEHSGATYADLATALGTNGANVPASVRKGGMIVKFINSTTNQYEQWRLMATAWSTNVSDWQGVDDEPIAGSKNLVESGGVYNTTTKYVKNLNQTLGIDKDDVIGINDGTPFNNAVRNYYYFQWNPLDRDVIIEKIYNLNEVNSTKILDILILNASKVAVATASAYVPANSTEVNLNIRLQAGYYIGFRSVEGYTLFSYKTGSATTPATSPFYYDNGTITENLSYSINFSLRYHSVSLYDEPLSAFIFDNLVPEPKVIYGPTGGSPMNPSYASYYWIQWNLLQKDALIKKLSGFEVQSNDVEIKASIFNNDFTVFDTHKLTLSASASELECNILVPAGKYIGISCPAGVLKYSTSGNPETTRFSYNPATGVAEASSYYYNFNTEYIEYQQGYIESINDIVKVTEEAGGGDNSLEVILTHVSQTIMLGDKTYIVNSPITLLSGTHIIGVRGKTIIKSASGQTIFTIPDGVADVTIENVTFEGSAPFSKTSMTLEQATTFNGMGSEVGIYATGHSTNIIINKCNFKNFNKAGIHLFRTFDIANNWKITDCIFAANYIGLYLDVRVEYQTIVGCTFNLNQIGCVITGGNNYASCCHFDQNRVGLMLMRGENDSHGTISGSSFNHNNDFAIISSSIRNGFVFSGCQTYDGVIRIDNSLGFTYNSGTIACDVVFSSQPNAGFSMIHDCIFRDVATLTIPDAAHVSLSGNRTYNVDNYSAFNNNY